MALIEEDLRAARRPAERRPSRRRRWALLAGATLTFAALTALVFVMRAGDSTGRNWPILWDLRNSDNGVLFQFSSDVFAGRTLDWSFSPQVYVFPEIPISLAAYGLAGGSAQAYYLMVAALNNALLFLALFAIVRYLFPSDSLRARLARTAVAASPLVLLPLLGTSQLYSYHLAPTYYYGMYAVIIAAPALFLARARWVRVAVGLAIALTGASNPLAFVFTVPALACVALIRARSAGWRDMRRPAAWVAAILLLAGAVRELLFASLQGGSPLSYIGTQLFRRRLDDVRFFLRNLLHIRTSAVITVIGAAAAVAGLIYVLGVYVLGVHGRRAAQRWDPPRDPRLDQRRLDPRWLDARRLTVAYYALVPLTGLAATAILLVTSYLYFWPVLVAPIVLSLLWLRATWVPRALVAAAAAFVVIAAQTGGLGNLASAGHYFTYRSAETQCLDERLPVGDTVGYATFSDARRLSLTSARGIRLIQLTASGGRAYWLTNRAYARTEVGHFFYINDAWDRGEPPISTTFLASTFGQPDSQFSCAEGTTVWLYDDPAKLAAIAARYEVRSP
ncbi:MAG: hypothetical protein QOC60_1097 [Frankiaceae bacterium]|nr:hypothetical protein [Frankiaceae bacterium]